MIRSSSIFLSFAVHHRVLEPAEDAGHGWVHGTALPLAARGVDFDHHPLDGPCRVYGVLIPPSIHPSIYPLMYSFMARQQRGGDSFRLVLRTTTPLPDENIGTVGQHRWVAPLGSTVGYNYWRTNVTNIYYLRPEWYVHATIIGDPVVFLGASGSILAYTQCHAGFGVRRRSVKGPKLRYPWTHQGRSYYKTVSQSVGSNSCTGLLWPQGAERVESTRGGVSYGS